MYLKRLEMQGFKSFVDRTVLEFDKGITAIVGPNGSGKSNISDAVKWVLGEQSPKTLRGSRMEDVIFAGTQNRKPVGMAEVSLIMDNEDHKLNIDYLEVKITRRLYRSGESEYLINGATCRLKDILMLFADTGIGRDGYSIIGQGRIDEVLNNRSEERRSIFEDASGIMKYRMRKVESERKLAATEQNLLRINDIVRELEIQIKPLAKQSEVARKYLSLKYELRDIEVGVLTRGIEQAEKQLEEVLKSIEILSGDKDGAEVQLVQIQNENQEKTDLSRTLDEQIARLREEEFEHSKRIERLKNEIALNLEKIASCKNTCEQAAREMESQQGRTSGAELEIKRYEDVLLEIASALEGVLAKGQAAADRLIAADQALASTEKQVEDTRDAIFKKKLEAGERENAITSLQQQIELVSSRKAELDTELHILEESDSLGDGELSEAEKAAEAKNDEAIEAKQQFKNNTERLTTLRSQAESYANRISSLSGKMRECEARVKLLKEMEEGFEGYARSVKEVLQMCKKNPVFGDGIYGAVAQLITVPGEYELAIETALGQSYQNIITESEKETKAAIEYLKEHRYGRATFMPITAAAGRRLEDQLQKELRGIPGYLGIASDRVECDDRFRKVVDSLLGRVAVFRTLDSALTAAKAHRYGFMCVTLEGDILRTTGAITGGGQERGQKPIGALSRTREIPELEKILDTSAREIGELMEKLGQAKEEAAALEQTQETQFEQVRALEKEASVLASTCAALRERRQARLARRNQLLEDLKNQIRFVVDSNRSIEEVREEAARLSEEAVALENSLAEMLAGQEASKQARDGIQAELFQLKVEEADLNGRKEKAEADIHRVREEISSGSARVTYYETQIKDSQDAIAGLEAENKRISTQIAVSEQDGAIARKKVEDATARKEEVDQSLGGMLTRMAEINSHLTRLTEEGNRLEIQRVRAENEINANKNRLWEEYELTYTAAAEMAKTIVIEDYKAASKQIVELRSAIKALGPVNVNAVEEYEATVKRYEFMSAQSKDMNESRLKLQKVVNELTAVMRTQFMEQFEIIRKNFSQVFSELFGGGKADIVLAEGEDVLECGIDINVQPPGKKLQNMMLLSGGERALTAIALLFGILRMRPSPFCLLDEIEAALDDANVYRLSDYLDTVAKNTQFIMVTHRKGTMENAESLYGVTMEEKGVSKVVSLKI